MPLDDDGTLHLTPDFRSLNCPVREVPALSKPGQDPTLRRWRLLEGSPNPQDSRLYLDRAGIEYLLANAQASLTSRAVVHAVEFEVELREAPNGHRYQVIHFTGVVAPEGMGASDRQIVRAGG